MKNRIIEKKEETNTREKQQKPKKKSGFSKFLNALLNGDFLTREGFIKQFPFIFFLTALFVGYIAMGYFYENTLREYARTKTELDQAKNIYHTTLHDLKEAKRQSTISGQLEELGFTNHVSQPRIIKKASE